MQSSLERQRARPAAGLAGELDAHMTELARFMTSHRLRSTANVGAMRDLSAAQIQALIVLAESELRMSELAGRLGLAESTVTRLVDRLEATKLVRRRATEPDRRCVVAELTPSGRRVAGEIQNSRRQFLSDMFGRRSLFLVSISIFLAGSALCGLSQSMTQLIAFRALQGFGAGGILPLAQATIGDLFSARERGRYAGYTGAVFASASIIGPLLGGYLTDSVSWRWIFYINLPLGALALLVVATRMQLPFQRREHTIDYLGSAVLTAAVGCLLMVAVWGGTTYPWRSPLIIGLAVAGALLVGVFVAVERRAE